MWHQNDPITFAGVKEREAPGTIIYIAKLRKYFVMEDDCEECKHDWEKKQKYHIDLWQGPDTVRKRAWHWQRVQVSSPAAAAQPNTGPGRQGPD